MPRKHVQFVAFANLMQPGERRAADLIGNNLDLTADDWPWQVPAGYVFRLTDASLGSKHLVQPGVLESSSMMDVVSGPTPEEIGAMLSVTDLKDWTPNRYIELPPGYYLNISFANTSPLTQNMNGVVLGYMVKS